MRPLGVLWPNARCAHTMPAARLPAFYSSVGSTVKAAGAFAPLQLPHHKINQHLSSLLLHNPSVFLCLCSTANSSKPQICVMFPLFIFAVSSFLLGAAVGDEVTGLKKSRKTKCIFYFLFNGELWDINSLLSRYK